MDKSARKRAIEIQARIRGILMESWDPLCVHGYFKPEDEYDSVIGRIYHCLREGTEEMRLASLLLDLEEEVASTRTGGQDLQATVRRLLEIDTKT